MITLNLRKNPYWIDLPDNVRVFVKPVTTAIMNTAQSEVVKNFKDTDAKPNDGQIQSDLIKALARKLLRRCLAGSAAKWLPSRARAGAGQPPGTPSTLRRPRAAHKRAAQEWPVAAAPTTTSGPASTTRMMIPWPNSRSATKGGTPHCRKWSASAPSRRGPPAKGARPRPSQRHYRRSCRR